MSYLQYLRKKIHETENPIIFVKSYKEKNGYVLQMHSHQPILVKFLVDHLWCKYFAEQHSSQLHFFIQMYIKDR